MPLSPELCEQSLDTVIALVERFGEMESFPEFLDPQIEAVWGYQFAPDNADARDEDWTTACSETDLVGSQTGICDDLTDFADDVAMHELSRNGQIVHPEGIEQAIAIAEIGDLVEHLPVDERAQHGCQRRSERDLIVDLH